MSRDGRPAITVLGLAKGSSAYLVVLIGAEYTQVAISRSTESGCASAFRAIPPTAVGGSFKPSLQRRAHSKIPEFHPRQWVDRSNPAYKDGRTRTSLNSTHGSAWKVQVLPITSETTNSSRSCSTGRG